MNELKFDSQRVKDVVKAIKSRFGFATQEEIADETGYTRQHLSEILNSDEPNEDFMTLLHVMFGANIEYMLWGRGEKLLDKIEVGRNVDYWVLQKRGSNLSPQDQSLKPLLEDLLKDHKAVLGKIESLLRKVSPPLQEEQGIEPPMTNRILGSKRNIRVGTGKTHTVPASKSPKKKP